MIDETLEWVRTTPAQHCDVAQMFRMPNGEYRLTFGEALDGKKYGRCAIIVPAGFLGDIKALIERTLTMEKLEGKSHGIN